MATDYRALWDELNTRQQTYLLAVYDQDQRQEENERIRANRMQRSRPADEWRWVEYDPPPMTDYTPPLKAELRRAGMVDPGTGSTFEALASRGYIKRKWDRYSTITGTYSALWVRMTPKGRKLVRQAKGYQAPKRRAKGELSPRQWDTLKKLYEAGEQGLDYHRLWWPHCVRLRDYTPPLLAEKRIPNVPGSAANFRVVITEAGRAFVEANRAHYEPGD